jgi:hypothetical protein
MPSKLEKDVKKEVRKVLDDLDAWTFMPVQTGYGMKGVPDFVSCIPKVITEDMVGQTIGIFVGVETKRVEGDPTALQELQLDRIFERGGGAYVVRGCSDEGGNFERWEATVRKLFK